MVKVIWTESAIDDMRDIAEYCDKHSEIYASTILFRLFNRIKILKIMPKIGRKLPERNSEKIRELIDGNYRIIYEIKNPYRIEILIVHHSSRPLNF